MPSKFPTSAVNAAPTKPYSQVHLKRAGKKLLLILPQTETKDNKKDWAKILQDLKYCLIHHKGTWTPGTNVHLLVENRLLDSRQFHQIGEALVAVDLKLTRVITSRRQTAVTAAAAGYSVEQESTKRELFVNEPSSQASLAEPLYLKTTVRSGVVIRHPGTVIIQGDVNPGGEIIANGDIIVWGCLRGVAHAGSQGSLECCIMALRMQPTQLRIADVVARPPSDSPNIVEPEVAYITAEGIRLKPALNFSKTHVFTSKERGWIEKLTARP